MQPSSRLCAAEFERSHTTALTWGKCSVMVGVPVFIPDILPMVLPFTLAREPGKEKRNLALRVVPLRWMSCPDTALSPAQASCRVAVRPVARVGRPLHGTHRLQAAAGGTPPPWWPRCCPQLPTQRRTQHVPPPLPFADCRAREHTDSRRQLIHCWWHHFELGRLELFWAAAAAAQQLARRLRRCNYDGTRCVCVRRAPLQSSSTPSSKSRGLTSPEIS